MNEAIKQSVDINFKINGCTPKRRLSYNYNNTSRNSSPIIGSKNVCKKLIVSEQSPQTINNSENESANESPIHIKRKCIEKDLRKFNQNGSPSFISSSNSNLVELYTQSDSPKQLNDSFETLKLNRDGKSIMRNMGRRASYQAGMFGKHKSAPLTDIINYNTSSKGGCYQPSCDNTDSLERLNRLKIEQNMLNVGLMGENLKKEGGGGAEAVVDLENFIFGTGGESGDQCLDNSDHHNFIKHSLEIDATCNNLIGDRSKQHILPIIPSNKHADLYCISPETLVDVLNGRFSDQIDEYVIIDSRYPYEYEGGHIANALNIYTKDKLYLEMFIKRLNFKCSNTHHHRLLSTSASTTCLSNTQPVHIDRNSQSFSNGCLTRFDKECNSLDNLDNEDDQFYAVNQLETSRSWTCAESLNTTLNNSTLNQSNHLQHSASKLNITNNSETTNNPSPNPNKRVIVIFHCEFSSERGPSLLRFLRNKDRALNEDVYPNLHYPELYLLEGGYKSFYENFKNYCDPQMYKPMLHAEHSSDLKHFRAKAKSWEVSSHLHDLLYISGECMQKQNKPTLTNVSNTFTKNPN